MNCEYDMTAEPNSEEGSYGGVSPLSTIERSTTIFRVHLFQFNVSLCNDKCCREHWTFRSVYGTQMSFLWKVLCCIIMMIIIIMRKMMIMVLIMVFCILSLRYAEVGCRWAWIWLMNGTENGNHKRSRQRPTLTVFTTLLLSHSSPSPSPSLPLSVLVLCS